MVLVDILYDDMFKDALISDPLDKVVVSNSEFVTVELSNLGIAGRSIIGF